MNDDAESKLAAPKLFGRKKAGGTPPAPDAEPAAAEPVAPDPVTPDPVTPDPVTPVPGAAEPEPVVPEPAVPEPLTPEPAAVDPVVPEPVAPEVVDPEPVLAPAPTPVRRAKTPKTPKAEKPPKPPKAPKPARERRPLPTVRLTGLQMAGIAGIVVGLFLVLATYGSLHLCATVRGADTCGGKAGFPLLVAIGILAVVGGGALLRLGGVRSPMGDSFLAVALVAVITVLFFGDHYDAWWMLIVVPLLGLLAYLLAHWVSVTYIDPVDDTGTDVDE